MKTAYFSGSVIGILALVSTIAAPPAQAQEKNPIDGEVSAASPCELFPRDSDFLCIQTIIPVKVELVARSGRRSFALATDHDGHLIGALPKGRYTLRVRKAQYGIRTFEGSELAVSPTTIRVGGGQSTTVALSIAHKSRILKAGSARTPSKQ
jgi:hypothetical protein